MTTAKRVPAKKAVPVKRVATKRAVKAGTVAPIKAAKKVAKKAPKIDRRDTLLDQLSVTKAQLDALSARYEQLTDTYIEAVEAEGDSKYTNTNGITGTIVGGTVLNIDEASLKKKLGDRWKKVSVEKLDKRKLNALMTVDDDVADILSSVSDEKPKKKHIRFS